MQHSWTIRLALAASMLAACDSGTQGPQTLPAGFEQTLSASGCADMNVFAKDAQDTIGLVLRINADLVADAAASGETYTAVHAVDDFQLFEVLVGMGVTRPECNDAIEPDATRVDERWTATGGEVEITIVPESGAESYETQGYASIRLIGVEVTLGESTDMLEDVTFEDIAVGWLPG